MKQSTILSVTALPSSPTRRGRFVALDGLRGLAALSVFVGHFILMLPVTPLISHLQSSPVRVLWDGTAAVDLFFVLSGFVLALPYVGVQPKALNYIDFVIRRAFRLYPAYWLALVVAIALRWLVQEDRSTNDLLGGLSPWICAFWHERLSAGELIKQVVLVAPGLNNRLIDPVIWSLAIEMRMSILVPFFIILHMRSSSKIRLLGLLITLIAGWYVASLQFMPLFYAGVGLAQASGVASAHRISIHNNKLITRTFIVVAVVLYGNRWLGGQWLSSWEKSPTFNHWISGVGALIAIALLTSGPSALRKPFESWLGSSIGWISYSFYLLHFPILIGVAALFWQRTHSVAIILAVALGVSITLASLATRFVENPFQKLGRKIGGAAFCIPGFH